MEKTIRELLGKKGFKDDKDFIEFLNCLINMYTPKLNEIKEQRDCEHTFVNQYTMYSDEPTLICSKCKKWKD